MGVRDRPEESKVADAVIRSIRIMDSVSPSCDSPPSFLWMRPSSFLRPNSAAREERLIRRGGVIKESMEMLGEIKKIK
jgi:hypothetical protein